MVGKKTDIQVLKHLQISILLLITWRISERKRVNVISYSRNYKNTLQNNHNHVWIMKMKVRLRGKLSASTSFFQHLVSTVFYNNNGTAQVATGKCSTNIVVLNLWSKSFKSSKVTDFKLENLLKMNSFTGLF